MDSPRFFKSYLQAELKSNSMLDYLIVGGGIAGSMLAFEFLKRGKKIALLDDNMASAACLVAAGVINPITGKRLVKSWRSDKAHSFAKKSYSELEKKLGSNFFYERSILQLCKSEEECLLWGGRLDDPEYAEFVDKKFPPKTFENLNDSCGSFLVGRSAWVEPRGAMEAFSSALKKAGVLFCEKFDYCSLTKGDANLSYKNFKFKKIIFCEGWKVLENPFFNWLPYRPAKGEIITLKTNLPLGENIVHRGNWIMKASENSFRMGSTWDRENLNSSPTDEARLELLKAVPSMFFSSQKQFKFSSFDSCGFPLGISNGDVFFEIEFSEAGVRPCTSTTRPLLGAHPEDSRILSFNGFGSKGFALSPYFAKHFADYLDEISPLDAEADLRRHVKKFYRPNSQYAL